MSKFGRWLFVCFLLQIVMAITCVISYPLSRLLDFLLGREIGTVYDRERLVELIRVTKDHNLLENDEVNIISGTLSLKRKTVGEIMTPLEDVFVLPYDAVLDFETLAEITREGRLLVWTENFLWCEFGPCTHAFVVCVRSRIHSDTSL